MNTCLLPVWFASMGGVSPPLDLVRPAGLERAPFSEQAVPPPLAEKTVLGDRLEHWLDTPNFTIQWNHPSVTEGDAEAAAQALEDSWSVLVDDHGWDPPVSGDFHKIWVILDPDLAATGLTTAIPSAVWPAGLPVIYVNPLYRSTSAGSPDFFASLCAHEFGHALQFRYRDWYGGDEREAWYWEATSEWMAEVVDPDWNQYAWSSNWYAVAPDADFYSLDGYHQYGMMLLNAHLDEHVFGPDGIWDVWWSNTGRPWSTELEEAAGQPVSEVWADFAGSYGGRFLADSALYEMPDPAPLSGRVSGELGTAYIDLGSVEGVVSVEGGIATLITDEDWTVFEGELSIPEDAGSVRLAVTNPSSDPLYYDVQVLPPGTDEPPEVVEADSGRDRSVKRSGCASAPVGALTGWWALLGLLRFRRGSPAESRRQ